MSEENYNPFVDEACTNLKKKVKEIADCCDALVTQTESKLEPNALRKAYVLAGAVLLGGYDRFKLADKVVEKTYPFWSNIEEKKEDFFLTKADEIFNEVPVDTKIFSELFEKDVLSTNMKNKLWKLFQDLIPLCCIYIHEMRGPIKIEVDGKMKGSYSKDYRNNVKIRDYVVKNNIKLRW